MSTNLQPSVPARPTFKGRAYDRDGSEAYSAHAYQYATTSQDPTEYKERELPPSSMAPAFVVFVADDPDIIAAINYARDNNLGVAVRSGGHQYIGSSSTSGNNIQIDLSGREADPTVPYPYKTREINRLEGTVTLGAGVNVDEVCEFAIKNGIFFPHGECIGVHMGGHSQTGGFSVITPTFGVMIDYMVRFTIILADGTRRTVERESTQPDDRDLWWAVLGGSPGNFGVVTSITVRYLDDSHYPESRGFKQAWLYSKDKLLELVQLINEFSDDPNRDPDFAFSLMALGAEYDAETPWSSLPDTWDNEMMQKYPYLAGTDRFYWVLPTIVVFGVWTNSKGEGQYDEKLVQAVFERFRSVAGMLPEKLLKYAPGDELDLMDGKKATPMSQILKALTFENPREFNMSCKKLAWFGKNTKTMSKPQPALGNRTFAEWLSSKVAKLESDWFIDEVRGLKAAIQVGMLGGEGLANVARPTSLAHRDGNYWFAFDVFYDPAIPGLYEKTIALTNDIAAQVTTNQVGLWDDDRERRLLLGPSIVLNEEAVLDKLHGLYYDSDGDYERLRRLKKRWDPKHVFTPNLFCIGATTCDRFARDTAVTD